MQHKKLYIIGNGFDLHHGLKSSYSDFRDFLKEKDDEVLHKLNEYLGYDSLWLDFEKTLSYLDTEQIVDECMDYLEPYSSEEWSDSYHHDYQFEVQKRIDIITKDLKERFTEWVLQIRIPKEAFERKIKIDRDSTFLNFNYTSTLQTVYGIDEGNILYVHNKAVDTNSTLIIGHARKPKKMKKLLGNQDVDIRIREGDEILDTYFEETYKPTEKIIDGLKTFFNQLKPIQEILVLGHSISSVDVPYFKEVVKNINPSTTEWKVSYRNPEKIKDVILVFKKLGIDSKMVQYYKIEEIDSYQLKIFK